MLKIKQHSQKTSLSGFTLVELIVVITILSILGLMAISSFQGHIAESRDADRLSTIKQLEGGLETYKVRSGTYPSPDGIISTGSIAGIPLAIIGTAGESVTRIVSMNKTPTDPLSRDTYAYATDASRKYYQIATEFEKTIADNNTSRIIPRAFAADVSQAKILGTYPGYLRYSSGSENWVTNTPSLIWNNTGSNIELTSSGTYYVLNQGDNFLGIISDNYTIQNMNGEELIHKIRNNVDTKLISVLYEDFVSLIQTGTVTGKKSYAFATGIILPSFGEDSIRKVVTAEKMVNLNYVFSDQIITPIAGLRISTGTNHACGINTNNKLYCWGYNYYGGLGDGTNTKRVSPTVIDSANTYTQVSVGTYYTCGIRTDGKLYCWGYNLYGQLGDGTTTDKWSPVPIDASNTYTAISAGSQHTCGIRTDGKLYCWGSNGGGRLGDGTTNQSSAPIAIDSGNTYTSVSAGGQHTCGIRTGGSLYCWGYNYNGQLGDNTTANRSLPTPIYGGGTYTQVSTGEGHTCGIRTDNKLYCWGYNGSGRLGDTTTTQRNIPTGIDSANTYTRITTGDSHTCGIRTDNKLYCWGYNYYGQLGDGTITDQWSPVPIDTTSTYATISAGNKLTCGIKSNNQFYCWGRNNEGQLGNGVDVINNTTPTIIDSTNTHTKTSAGRGYYGCGLKSDGKLSCWGSNYYGELGDGTTTTKYSPAAIDSANTYTIISTGELHTCGIRSDNKLYCWGYNYNGQLGDGTATGRTVPTAIDSINTYVQVSAGNAHTCGIRSDGKLYCWGANSSGQLGNGTTNPSSVPIAIDSGNTYTQISAGNYYTCGIRTGGALYCWGTDGYWQLGDGSTTQKTSPTAIDSANTYSKISAGVYHTCGIRTGGALYCWGINLGGQLGDGTTSYKTTPYLIDSGNSYTQISAGGGWDRRAHTCGIRTDNKLYCWGYNPNGQVGDGTLTDKLSPTLIDGSNTYVSVSAGGIINGNVHTCGVRSDGKLYGWGSNYFSQLGILQYAMIPTSVVPF